MRLMQQPNDAGREHLLNDLQAFRGEHGDRLDRKHTVSTVTMLCHWECPGHIDSDKALAVLYRVGREQLGKALR